MTDTVKVKVYVAYETSGRDKYEYDTALIGVYKERKDACKAMRQYMFEARQIFPYYDDKESLEEIFGKFPDFEARLAKCMSEELFVCEFMDDVGNLEQEPEFLAEEYGNSYYGDGWDITILCVDVE